MNGIGLLLHRDAVGSAVGCVLLVMSVATWVVLFWKSWLLWRAAHDVARCTLAYWQAPSLADGLRVVQALDREGLLAPMAAVSLETPVGTLAAAGDRAQHLTRLLRNALHGALRKLQAGQVVLATVGATAPFVGLLGTVWGIYQALLALAGAGQITVDAIAGPVGESLTMTAAGLAVAIPAVLGYNLLGRVIAPIAADLEGFARDQRDLLLSQTS